MFLQKVWMKLDFWEEFCILHMKMRLWGGGGGGDEGGACVQFVLNLLTYSSYCFHCDLSYKVCTGSQGARQQSATELSHKLPWWSSSILPGFAYSPTSRWCAQHFAVSFRSWWVYGTATLALFHFLYTGITSDDYQFCTCFCSTNCKSSCIDGLSTGSK